MQLIVTQTDTQSAITLNASPAAATAIGDEIRPESFGAKGDGVTDDSAAFIAAIGTGLPLRLSAKTYGLNAPFTIAAATTFRGTQGQSVLKRLAQTTGTAFITVAGSSFRADGVVVDANKATVTLDSMAVLVTAACGFSDFDRCIVRNAGGATMGSGLVFQTSTASNPEHTAWDCDFTGCQLDGAWAQATAGVSILASRGHDNGRFNINAAGSIAAVIANNRVWNAPTGINAGGSQNTRVIDNVVTACTVSAIAVQNAEADQTGTPFGTVCSGLAINRNTILLAGTSALGVTAFDNAALAVTGNMFVGNGGALATQCISAATPLLTVSGNSFNGSTRFNVTGAVVAGVQTIIYPDIADEIRVMTVGGTVMAMVSASQAAAAGQVVSCKVSLGGSGYTHATISFGGSGTGATASAIIAGGVIVGIRMTASGSGYGVLGASVPITITGDGSGASATALSSFQQPARRLSVLCDVSVTFAATGANPPQNNVNGADLTIAALGRIDWNSINGAWRASFLPGTGLPSVARNIIDVAAILGADPSSGSADSAMDTAIAQAAAKPGSVIWLCPSLQWTSTGTVSTGPRFAIPSNTLVKGAGVDQTVFAWNDAGSVVAFNLFGAAANATNVAFEDFTVRGSWDTNGQTISSHGYPFQTVGANGVRFTRVGTYFSRNGGIHASQCVDVEVDDCKVRYCAADGIGIWQSSQVNIHDNTVEHCDDDGISVHSLVGDAWGVRRNISITGNRLFDCQGITAFAPRSATICGNTISCTRQTAIAFIEQSSSGATGGVVVVAGNTITNTIDRTTIDNLNNGCSAITIQGSASRAGTLGTVPGENVTSSGTVIDPTAYFLVNSASSAVATSISRGYLIIGNVIARTLPASDGSVTAPQTFSSWADYGFGPDPVGGYQMFTRLGWVTPSLSEAALRPVGVSVSGGIVALVRVVSNQFIGIGPAFTLATGTVEDFIFTGNDLMDCGALSLGGMVINTGGPCRVVVSDNRVDVDPYQKAPNRLPHGCWNVNAATPSPAGLWIQSGSGVVVERNRWRNCVAPVWNATGTAIVETSGNWIEGNPVGAGANLKNAGVGTVPLDGTRVLVVDSDSYSATWGQVLSAPVTQSIAMPTTGFYVPGDEVKDTFAQLDGNGWVRTGWRRLTAGTSAIEGTDWIALYAYTGSLDITAAPVIGATGGQVAAIVIAGPPGGFQFFTSMPWPAVTIDPPGAGGVQATATIDQQQVVAFDATRTLNASSEYMLAGATIGLPAFVNAGSSYADGDTLTAAGTWITPYIGTLSATGTSGPVGNFVVVQYGVAASYPGTNGVVSFTGGHGAGFQMNVPLFAPVHIQPLNPGWYPNNATPNATLPGFPSANQSAGLLTIKMNHSMYADETGLHSTRTSLTGSIARPWTLSSVVVNGGTLTLVANAGPPPTFPGRTMINLGTASSIGTLTVVLPVETTPLDPGYEQQLGATGSIGTVTLVSPTGAPIHAGFTSLSATSFGSVTFHTETSPHAWFPL